MAKRYTAGSLSGPDFRHIRLGLLMTQRELARQLGYRHKIRISEFERHTNPVPIPLPIQEEMIRLYTSGGTGTPGVTAVRGMGAEGGLMSTAISDLDYDEYSETLTVGFTDGSVYAYWNVPAEEYANLLYASSAGTYFNANVRNAGYNYRQM